jgi:amino acid transporter
MVEHTRTLGFKVAFAIGLGTMIAAGIFSLSGVAVAEVGSSAVIAFVIAALVAGLTAASYSEFASIYSENGGGYLFSSRTFDDRDRLDPLVYFIGASLFLGYTGTTAFYLSTMDHWFFRFIVPAWLPAPDGTVAVLAALLLGGLNAKGTEESGAFQLLVTSAKVAVLLVFIAGVVGAVGPAQATGHFVGRFELEPVNILTIASLAFITFFGFSAIAASAGEIIQPRKTVPRAIGASIITVTVLYTLVIVAMVNSPVPAEVIAQEGETAMGRVASAALGPIGFWLIVAGAAFSMVSASNASILAASGIGSLMGRQGHAPRRFARIHREYGTPFWSVMAATLTIVVLVVVFLGIFPADGGFLGVDLGLTALTGFATLNLLVPLSFVNLALIYSRRRHEDIERPFRVPLVPLLPVLGIIANLTLITNLPFKGIVVGVLLIVGVLVTYAAWGGAPRVEELYEEVVPSHSVGGGGVGENSEFRVLVPVAAPANAPNYIRLAARIGEVRAENPVIEVLNVTEIPDQTPSEVARDRARRNLRRVETVLEDAALDVDFTVEAHTCRDTAFDILNTARNNDADLILMGYPEDRPDITESVEYDAPCDVVFVTGEDVADRMHTLNLGVGGGPHHLAALPMVNDLVTAGADLNLINVRTADAVPEDPGRTLARLADQVTAAVHTIEADTIAAGLLEAAGKNGGVLIVGASRTRRLRQWIFGSTPDRTVELAAETDLPVLVYASSVGITGRIEGWVFPVYRYLRKQLSRGRTAWDIE